MVHTDSLKTHIEPLVEAGGAHLVELVFHPEGRRRVLEVYADTEVGITADTLAALSRSIGTAIDENGWITETYHLVVSSPGLDRPVRQPWQFRRHLGRTVTLSIIEGDEKRNITGRILEVEDEQLIISLNDGAQPIPFERIESAFIQALLQDTKD
ncbi:MAG: ribosome maturation factor RimP [Bacteroidota bacterium]